jgi:uncharacterized protein (TIGR02246 family)
MRPAEETSAPESGVRAALAGLDAAFAARDFNRVMDYYTADAVLYLPGKPPITGHPAIRQALTEAFADPFVTVQVTIERVEAHEGSALAAACGSGVTRVGDPAAKSTFELHTHWLAVLRREGGAWRMAMDMISAAD